MTLHPLCVEKLSWCIVPELFFLFWDQYQIWFTIVVQNARWCSLEIVQHTAHVPEISMALSDFDACYYAGEVKKKNLLILNLMQCDIWKINCWVQLFLNSHTIFCSTTCTYNLHVYCAIYVFIYFLHLCLCIFPSLTFQMAGWQRTEPFYYFDLEYGFDYIWWKTCRWLRTAKKEAIYLRHECILKQYLWSLWRGPTYN